MALVSASILLNLNAMSSTEILSAANALPLKERIKLAEKLWSDILDTGVDPELSAEQVAELDRRAEEALKFPERGVSAEEVFRQIEKRLRERQ
jgi:putative addiction module component (TIGR02574 family)